MEKNHLFTEWLNRIAAAAVVLGRPPREEANENTKVFEVEDARSAGVRVAELCDFLRRAFRAYSVQAARTGVDGWFYAWHDEASGTLRCSVSSVSSPTDLPFSCDLDIHGEPEAIAEAALASPYASGIPLSELREITWPDTNPEEPNLLLSVFAKRLIR